MSMHNIRVYKDFQHKNVRQIRGNKDFPVFRFQSHIENRYIFLQTTPLQKY